MKERLDICPDLLNTIQLQHLAVIDGVSYFYAHNFTEEDPMTPKKLARARWISQEHFSRKKEARENQKNVETKA